MLLGLRTKSVVGVFSVALAVASVSCSKNEQKPDEVVTPEAVDSPGAPEDVGNLSGAQDLASQAVYFAFDDYTINAAAEATLGTLGDKLKGSAATQVQVQGHCDERGSIEYNLALGKLRAEAVKKYLVSVGVSAAQLSTVSYGEVKPAVEGHDESAWSQNRRADFVVTGK